MTPLKILPAILISPKLNSGIAGMHHKYTTFDRNKISS